MFFLLVEIDKKIIFHNILAMEYLMKNKNYSNTDYFFSTCMSIMLFAFALLWTFIGSAYRMFSPSTKIQRVITKIINSLLPCFTFFQVPALYKSILLFLWQSAIPIIVFYNIFAFRKFAVTKIKSYIDEIKGRFEFHLQKLKLRNNSVGISPSEVQRHFDT